MIDTQLSEASQLQIAGGFPQLGFEIDNPDAPNTIYISTDPSANDLTFKITTNAAATFEPGTPVAPNKAKQSTGSLVYLDLTALQLTRAAFDALTITVKGWSWAPYPDNFTICLTPNAELTLGPSDAVSVKIGEFTLPNAPSSSSVSLTATYYRVDPITVLNFPVPTSFGVSLQQPPAGHANLKDAIAAGPATQVVVVNDPLYPKLNNSLQIVLGPGPTPRDVIAGDETTFTLTFVYASGPPGYGALIRPEDANSVTVTQGPGAEDWQISPGTDQENPSWLLQPPAGTPILGGGPKTTVQFDVSGISTNFRPGPTLAILSYGGIDGYDSGAYTLFLQKTPHVSISEMKIKPNPTVLTEGSAEVTISWETQYAGTLTLYPLYKDVTGKKSFTTKIDRTTQFSLQAVGLYGYAAGNVALRSETAYITPQINSFTASPAAIAATDFPRDVALTWNVNTNGQVKLTSSVTGPDGTLYQPLTTITKSITAPQMLTLIPVDTNDPSIRRSRLIAAFALTASSQTIPSPAAAVAASPAAGFVAVANAADGTVSILGTLTYQTIGQPIGVGTSPSGLAFSPDGSLLFVANAGSASVSVVSISTAGGQPSFSVVSTVGVGGPPQSIAVAPDARYVYVSVDNGSSGSLAMLVKQEDGTYTAGTPIAVGKRPRGVAVLPTGARVYVANSGDDSVSVIGNNKGVLGLATTVTGLASSPVDVAITPDGATLLVVCSGSSTVFALSATAPDGAARYPCTVGASPARIAVVPNGGYAFVANAAGNSVSMLRLSPQDANPIVQRSVTPLNASPRAIAVSGSGGLVITANANASLSVVALGEYAARKDPKSTGGGVDSALAAPDGKTVLIWHNLNVTTIKPGEKFATAMSVYDVASDTVSQHLEGQKLSGCAYLAGKPLRIAVGGATSIDVVDASSFETKQTLALPAHGATATLLNVGASADGGVLAGLVSLDNGEYRVQVFTRDSDGTYALNSDVVAFTVNASTFTFIAVSPDGAKIYAVDSLDGQVWTVARGAGGTYSVEQQPIATESGAVAVALSPDGARLYLIIRSFISTSLAAIDTASGKVTSVTPTEISAAVTLTGMTVSPDGSTLFVTDAAYAGIRAIDAASLQYLQTISWPQKVQFPNAVAALPDGSQLFVANVNTGNFAIARLVQPS